MDHPRAICFAGSHLQWITCAERSHGWFQIDSLLEWLPVDHQQHLQFVLAARVPAGRMYVSQGPLLKQPPYTFQLIAGQYEHTIMRRPMYPFIQSDLPSDSSQPHHHIFESLSWALNYSDAQRLQPEDLAAFSQPPPVLNFLLEWRHHGGLVRLQAPLRHWNYRADPPGWQIETGPILWPLDRFAFAQAPSSAGLTSAWLHANQAGRVTLSGDGLACHELEADLSLLALK